MKTYLDKLLENPEFKDKFEEEYKVMEVKEAIEFLKLEKGDYETNKKYLGKKLTFEEWDKCYNEVISLIKQLDKSRQMWEKLGLLYIEEYKNYKKGGKP